MIGTKFRNCCHMTVVFNKMAKPSGWISAFAWDKFNSVIEKKTLTVENANDSLEIIKSSRDRNIILNKLMKANHAIAQLLNHFECTFKSISWQYLV